jgi:anti-anti-sigma regulatory factor
MQAERIASELRNAYPIFLAGRLFGPTSQVRRGIGLLQERLHSLLGRPTWSERILSVAAVALAAWTGLTLKLRLFQHPPLMRHTFRIPAVPGRHGWRAFGGEKVAGLSIDVEHRPASTVWVHLKGRLNSDAAVQFVTDLRAALARKEDRVVLDLASLADLEHEAAQALASGLKAYRDRIRVILPLVGECAALAAMFPIYR